MHQQTIQHRPAASLRTLTDDELAAAYVTGDATTQAAVLAEAARRDRAEAARKARAAVRAEWAEGAHAQYLAAEAATNGYLLSREGQAAGIDPWALWAGPERVAMRYASEELREFWQTTPRLTVSAYRQQLADARRIARDEADLAAWEAEMATQDAQAPAAAPQPAPAGTGTAGRALVPASTARPATARVDARPEATPAGRLATVTDLAACLNRDRRRRAAPGGPIAQPQRCAA